MSAIDETHDPARTSWVPGADAHRDFPVQNLPLGVFRPAGGAARIGTAIGDFVVDLNGLARAAQLTEGLAAALSEPTLNALFALAPDARRDLRRRLSDLLSNPARRAAVEPHLSPAGDCAMELPTRIGGYTDFYAGIHHAMNIGRLFRPDDPLLANYKYVPIGYHGRASSVRVSGAPVVRPGGQTKAPSEAAPTFGPCRRLDYELELGIWVGAGNALGRPVPIGEAEDHIAGFGLLNDWSARDLQAWEYQPLGPFLAKNFLTTVSPWVVTTEALAPFRIAQEPRPDGDPRPLEHLWNDDDQARGALAITLEVFIATAKMRADGQAPQRLGLAAARHLYWTPAQMLAHHTSNGCDLAPGDLLGTGTISAPTPDGWGSLMELSRGGSAPLALANTEIRTFLEDGDEIAIVGRAEADGRRCIGFGECRGTVRTNG